MSKIMFELSKEEATNENEAIQLSTMENNKLNIDLDLDFDLDLDLGLESSKLKVEIFKLKDELKERVEQIEALVMVNELLLIGNERRDAIIANYKRMLRDTKNRQESKYNFSSRLAQDSSTESTQPLQLDSTSDDESDLC